MRFALIVLAGCSRLPAQAAPSAGTLAEPSMFAIPGESLEYSIALRGIALGRLRVAIGNAGWIDGRQAVIARSRGESDGVVAIFGKLAYELHTTLDLDGHRPIEHHEESWVDVPGAKHHDVNHGFDDQHDAHSAIGLLRGGRRDRAIG